MNPEIPGFCVKEKDLQPCFSSRDCDARLKCSSLGRDGEQYCVSRPNIAAHDIIDDLPIINVPSSANQMRFESEGKAGLGRLHLVRRGNNMHYSFSSTMRNMFEGS